MRNKRPWHIRNQVYILLALITVSFLMGLSGYLYYYSSQYSGNNEVFAVKWLTIFFDSVYSTLKLYTAGWDVSISWINTPSADPAKKVFLNLLFCAKYMALLPTGVAIIKTIKALLPQFFSNIAYESWTRFNRNKLLLIGNNTDNMNLYRTSKRAKDGMLLSEVGKDTQKLREEGIRYYTPRVFAYDETEDQALEDVLIGQLEITLKKPNKKLTVIINTGNDERNLHLCEVAVRFVKSFVQDQTEYLRGKTKNDLKKPDSETLREMRKFVEKLERIRVAVAGSKDYEQLYNDLEQESFYTLNYTNKYHITAFDFVDQYPMTKFMPGLKKDGCVPKDMDLNFLLVGFGDTNKEIMLESFPANQYVFREKNQLPALKPLHYYIFDKAKTASHDKNLNHTLFRYIEDFRKLIENGKVKQEDYFEFPPAPIDYEFNNTDINSEEFYDTVREICIKNPRSLNYLVIAFGDDFSNLDLAQRLVRKKMEWKIENLIVFVKVRSNENIKIARLLDQNAKNFIPFGNEEFKLEQLTENRIEKICYDRKRLTLNIEKEPDLPGRFSDPTIIKLYEWRNMDIRKHHSSIYNILDLRAKLNLIGLDYEKKRNAKDTGITQDEYFDIYAKGQVFEKSHDASKYRGAKYEYPRLKEKSEFLKGACRDNLCVQEHYRWNAYMIRCGFIPMPLEEFKQRKASQDYEIRRTHANLCSFPALFDFRTVNAEINHLSPKDADVIVYDYTMMDEAWYYLDACGYRIIKRIDGVNH